VKLWQFLAPLPTLAIGMAVVKYGLWYGSTSHGGDGTCEGLEGLAYCGLGIALMMASALIPFVPRIFQRQEGQGGPEYRYPHPPATLHPSQDPTSLFD
jgi:hypothetical protein